MLKRKSTWKGFKPKLRIALKRSGINRATKQRRAKVLKERLWANEIRARDNDTCQRCGFHGKGLDVHHIAPRSRRPDLKFVDSNSVTLDRTCHQWVHDHPREATELGLLSDVPYERKEAA